MKVEIIGLDKTLRKLDQIGDWKPLGDLLTEASLIGQKEAKATVPRDTGALGRSIQRSIKPFSASIYTVKEYAVVQEFGAPSPEVNNGALWMPPSSALAGWARRHGRNPFVVARGIRLRGIKGRFFMRSAKEAVDAALPRLVRKLGEAVEDIWRGK